MDRVDFGFELLVGKAALLGDPKIKLNVNVTTLLLNIYGGLSESYVLIYTKNNSYKIKNVRAQSITVLMVNLPLTAHFLSPSPNKNNHFVSIILYAYCTFSINLIF